MSGIEVAGLVLGALPILFQAVDFYRDGIGRSLTALRKRKYVEKLSHALLLQQQILEETVRSVIVASGCEDIVRLDDDPLDYLNDEYLQEQVLDYLGEKNINAFNGTLEQSNTIVKKLAGSMAGFVPAFKVCLKFDDSYECKLMIPKGPADDLLGIITANREAHPKQLDFIPRVKLLFGVNELKDFVQDLDDTTNRLSSFTRIVISNRQIGNEKTSPKSIKLAKALRQVRGFASNLYTGLCQGWKADCHNEHEAKLFLEDRLDAVTNILRSRGRSTLKPTLDFKLIFVAGADQGHLSWNEAAVRVYHDEYHQNNQSSPASRVKIVTPEAKASEKPEVTFVGDICGAIETARCVQRSTVFILTENHQVGMTNSEEGAWVAPEKSDSTSLKALLFASTEPHRRAPVLPWKFRMLIALTLSSNLLQLLQTQWLESAWSKDKVYFLSKTRGSLKQQIDLSRPFISLSFGATSPNGLKVQVQPKIALLELGILLLEIWYETCLETRFALAKAPTGYYERLALALEWLDDTSNPLPELYEKAVSHCIHSTVGGEFRLSDWDDMKFWEAVCEDVIEPLSKICKQWH
ncbi:hypothetical protein NHQ30_006242 [Ciborinia camelliae]|nr:hypothetical protein NHQ30_006242 [Ciborinia camelliae]